VVQTLSRNQREGPAERPGSFVARDNWSLMTARVLAVVLAFALSACRGLDDPGAGVGVFFPRYGNMGPTPLALSEGRLEVNDGCLWLVRTVGTKILPIWPGGYGLRGSVGSLQVTDAAGHVVAAEGQNVRMGGGEYARADARRLMGREEQAACGGNGFWLVGSITASLGRSSTP
jgi:hypothetical protein